MTEENIPAENAESGEATEPLDVAASENAESGEVTETLDVAAEVAAEVADDYDEAEAFDVESGVVGDPAAPLVHSGPAQAVGRRKEAVARVRLVPGSGEFTINGRTLDHFFPNKVHQQLIKSPLVTVEREEQFDLIALIHGGGASGQAGALRLAIARALTVYSPDDRPTLKKEGFLTRDARAVERKKAGLKKARKAPQYSKR